MKLTLNLNPEETRKLTGFCRKTRMKPEEFILAAAISTLDDCLTSERRSDYGPAFFLLESVIDRFDQTKGEHGD